MTDTAQALACLVPINFVAFVFVIGASMMASKKGKP